MEIIDKTTISSGYVDDIQNTLANIFTKEGVNIDLDKLEIKVTRPLYNFLISHGFSLWLEQYNVEVTQEFSESNMEASVLVKSEQLEEEYLLKDYYLRFS